MYPILEDDRKYVYKLYIGLAVVCFLCSWYWLEVGAFHFAEMFKDITAVTISDSALDLLQMSMPVYLAGAYATRFNRAFRLEIFRVKWNLRYLCSKLCRRIPPLSAIGLGVTATFITAGIIYGYGLK